MEEEYKGVKIKYSEFSEKFEVKTDDFEYSAAKLSDLKARIDAKLKYQGGIIMTHDVRGTKGKERVEKFLAHNAISIKKEHTTKKGKTYYFGSNGRLYFLYATGEVGALWNKRIETAVRKAMKD